MRRILIAMLTLSLLVALFRPTFGQAVTHAASGCQFLSNPGDIAAFCDTFDAPAGTGNRSGDLNGLVWGTSRTSEGVNPGSGVFDGWIPTNRTSCGTQTVQPEHDIAVCNGQMAEATTDGGNFTTLAMYPTQPFDIAGRTGTVVFDVSADSEGPHAAWPSFVYTDQPVPAPTDSHPATAAYAQNSFGFSLDAGSTPCTPGSSTGVDDAYATTNYVERPLAITYTATPCVTDGSSGAMNHVEVRISQSQVQVWATNAGSTTLQEIAVINNANLTLTRGLVWLEDQHYFADKFNDQGTHTFTWDNVGFDGPTLPRDLHLDVNDSFLPNAYNPGPNPPDNADGSVNLGWYAPAPSGGTPLILQVPGATDLAQASSALLTLNFWPTETSSLLYRLNGHAWHTLAWPFPDSATYAWRTIALPVPLAELIPGTNTLDLEATQGGSTVANVDLILVGAQGMPGETPTPAPATPTASSTMIPPSATATNTVTPSGTAPVPPTETSTPRDTATLAPSSTPSPTATPLPINAVACTILVGGQQLTGTCSGTFQG